MADEFIQNVEIHGTSLSIGRPKVPSLHPGGVGDLPEWIKPLTWEDFLISMTSLHSPGQRVVPLTWWCDNCPAPIGAIAELYDPND